MRCAMTAHEWRRGDHFGPDGEELVRTYHLPRDHVRLLGSRGRLPHDSLREVISRFLAFGTECLRSLPEEDATCFIAMPFRPPFEGQWPLLYAPLLERAGVSRILRAWGGFGQEDFSPFVVAAILKSGMLLADLTQRNRNVIWEMGLAQGMGKVVFGLVAKSEKRLPSDLVAGIMVRYHHQPSRTKWAEEVGRLAGRATLLLKAMKQKKADPISLATGVRLFDIGETAGELAAMGKGPATGRKIVLDVLEVARGAVEQTSHRR